MSNSNPFDKPATATGIQWPDLLGRLLLVEPHGVEHDIKTVHGPSDAVKATVTVIDGDDGPEEFVDTLIFPKVLQGQLRSKVGAKVLGRLGQGVAKPGQDAPWMLNEAAENDYEVGKAYLEQRTGPALTSPTSGSSGDVPF